MLASLAIAKSVGAQSSSTGFLKLYVDPKTRQIFPDPGKGRVFLAEVPVTSFDANALERRVEEKTQAQLDANKQQLQQLVQSNEELTRSNADLQRQVVEMQPAWRSYIDDFARKFRVGTLVYADYRMYTHTTFQPQELENINNPGPQNNLFNSFDITRSYLNFFFFPTDGLTFRVTPDIYRAIGNGTNPTIGHATTFASNLREPELPPQVRVPELQ
ncbi:MAG TPA: hypothetical protein VGI36_05170 [Candidatus Binataceae bacterium]